jgi:hypothetical protein
MKAPPPTRREERVQQRARADLGPEVVLTRRVLVTRAGPRRGRLVVGYRLCRPIPSGNGAPPTVEVLDMSPLRGEGVDLSNLGTPEDALEDAVQRRSQGLGAYPDECPGDPLPEPAGTSAAGTPVYAVLPLDSELTTSTMDLPVV